MNDVLVVSIQGKGKWAGLVACGNYDKMLVVESTSDCNIDLIPPVITILGDNPVNIFVGEPYTDEGATALDNVDGDLTYRIIVEGTVNPNVPGIYTIIYYVMDNGGNERTATRTIDVIDNVAPTVAFGTNGNSTYAKRRSTTVTVSDIGAIDNSSLKYVWTTSEVEPSLDEFTSSFINNQTINTPNNVTGGYYLWILAKDIAGNTEITRTNIFNLDNTKPVITMNGTSPVTVNKGSLYTDAGATASDAHSGTNGSVTATGSVNVNVVGTYTITYTVSDKAGNDAVVVIRIINVVDVSAPIITIKGDNPATINVGSIYSDAGAIAVDDVDGDVTNSIQTTGTVNPSVVGTYTITYTVSDTAGNISTAKRTVNVVDNIAPTVVFGMNGNSTYAKSRSTTVTVSDAHSSVNTSSLKYQWTTSTTAPTEASFSTTFTNGGTISSQAGVSGGYYLWILAKDSVGNTTITRTNIFNLDNTAPVITSVTMSASNITANGFTINRSGDATDAHSGLATNPYIYQTSLNGSTWITKCTNNTTTCNVTGLNESTTYYYRICVDDVLGNQSCTASNTVQTISPWSCGQNLTDTRDNKVYKTTKIGTQCWFAENLKYTGNGCLSQMWGTGTINACLANGTEIHYQWGAAMNGSTTQGAQGSCPSGWHIPTDEEWKILEGTVDSTYGIGNSVWNNTGWRGSDVGKKLKAVGANGTDDYGFNGLLAGTRADGNLCCVGYNANWWSSSPSESGAWYRGVDLYIDIVVRHTTLQLGCFSVRCVRD
jgi:uncharacterized protein (TIGR02145 family)